MKLTIHLLAVFFAVALIGGCAKISEKHYFTSVSADGGQSTNYFRLTVEGSAQFSSARYVAGYYDERAVDLFFNELKTVDTSNRELFSDTLKSPGSNEVIKPLDPSKRGAFVMIHSTNASDVANTIGNFADSNVAADALTNLLNQSDIAAARESDALLTVRKTQAVAVAGQVEQLLNLVPRPGTPAERKNAYLRVLNAIASGSGSPQDFKSFTEAKTWLKTARQMLAVQQ